MFETRMAGVRERMADMGIDILILSVGADLPWLVGYAAMPLERLTMLVLPRDGDATLVVPRLEVPRVRERPELFRLHAWSETEDPSGIVARLVGDAATVAIGDRTWARFLVELIALLPHATFVRSQPVIAPLRAVKDESEVAALRRAAVAADRVANRLRAGEIQLTGRTEAEVSAELGRQLLAEGHSRVNFAIVAAGENSASPHHDPGQRIIREGEIVLCDFGGTMADADGVGYCSDITRCLWTGEPPEEAAAIYRILQEAQAVGSSAARAGTACAAVDAACRQIIDQAGFGAAFIHRTGHGIGIEEHEAPYIVSDNPEALSGGHAFSIEPGIYLPGRFGFRLEDIVVCQTAGPESLNQVGHDLVSVEA